MKKINLIILLLLALVGIAFAIRPAKAEEKQIKINVSYKVETAATVPTHFADTLKRAQELLSRVFSSKEFKEELYSSSYSDSAYSKSKKACFDVVYDRKTGRVSGEGVYNNLLANSEVELMLTIKNNGSNKKTMGSSSACANKITTYDYWLTEKEGMSIRLARHIAHEFTHIRGYRHDNKVDKAFKWGNKPSEDPANGVGSIVGEILARWTKKGLI